MTPLLARLEQRVGKKVDLRLNNNRSTYLSVRWESKKISLSLHKFFLEAPEDVLDSLGSYLRREKKRLDAKVKSFIHEALQTLSHEPAFLDAKGSVYDLEEIYQSINRDYFAGGLDLKITWFGERVNKSRTRLSYGSYWDAQKLIKIHRMMDVNKFPREVVRFVVYHEMLHAVCRPEFDEVTSRTSIHTREFRKREREFREYNAAKLWMDKYTKSFFKGEY